MPTFIITGRFTQAAIKGLVAKPENREPAVRALCEAVGARLISYYITTGQNDFLLITEGPNAEAAGAAVLTASASGTICDVVTVQAWSSADFAAVCGRAGEVASSYRSPGN